GSCGAGAPGKSSGSGTRRVSRLGRTSSTSWDASGLDSGSLCGKVNPPVNGSGAGDDSADTVRSAPKFQDGAGAGAAAREAGDSSPDATGGVAGVGAADAKSS